MREREASDQSGRIPPSPPSRFVKIKHVEGFEAKLRPVLPATSGAGDTGQKILEDFLSG